ncbi:nucleotidyltransferase family protein [Mariniluteicoccus flavus]
MTTTRAVILARGLGTRMRKEGDAALTAEQQAAADAGVKAMMPIGRPFLDHSLSALADAGITEACLVIGPEHQGIRDYYADLPTSRISVTWAIQEKPLGTADAVAAAELFAGDESFVVLNGDNYYGPEALRAAVTTEAPAVVGFSRSGLVEHGNIPAERIAAFALLDVDPAGALVDIVEKPSPDLVEAHGPDPLVSMNCLAFTPRVFEACRNIAPSARGELEIVDAIRWLVAAGERVGVPRVDEGVLDLSSRGDVESVTQALRGREVTL